MGTGQAAQDEHATDTLVTFIAPGKDLQLPGNLVVTGRDLSLALHGLAEQLHANRRSLTPLALDLARTPDRDAYEITLTFMYR